MCRIFFTMIGRIRRQYPRPPFDLFALGGVAAAIFLLASVSLSPSAEAAQKSTATAPQNTAQGANARTRKIPEQQARVCEIFQNWRLREGYARGAEPKPPDPNPIKAAQAPPLPDPGNIFDQLIAILGTGGAINGWKGTALEPWVEGQFVHVRIFSYCPESPDSLPLQTKAGHLVPLKSPIAEVLSTVNFRANEVLTFSGHLFYNAAIRFYDGVNYLPEPPRKGSPSYLGQSPSQQYVDHGPPELQFEFTSITK